MPILTYLQWGDNTANSYVGWALLPKASFGTNTGII